MDLQKAEKQRPASEKKSDLTMTACVCEQNAGGGLRVHTAEPSAASILNRVARDKLPHVLTHILDKLTTNDAEVFSAQETQQLQEMLSFSQDDIDTMVALVQDVFLDAARFCKVDRYALLTCEGVDSDVVAMLEKAWRKKGKALLASEPFANGKHPMDVAKLPVLRATEWQLHLEMGQSKLRGRTTPTALFQLELAAAAVNAKDDEAVGQKDEKVDLEMNHDELRTFFHELNAIQAHLDRQAHAAV